MIMVVLIKLNRNLTDQSNTDYVDSRKVIELSTSGGTDKQTGLIADTKFGSIVHKLKVCLSKALTSFKVVSKNDRKSFLDIVPSL